MVVAHGPGSWFEECLESISRQDYPNLSVLVIDAGSAVPVKDRVAAVAPSTFVRRIEPNPGFGAAANEVLDVVEGAAFYLFCHDDVASTRTPIRILVEEAFRSNAGSRRTQARRAGTSPAACSSSARASTRPAYSVAARRA